jgi:hypothetical protein
MILEVEKAFCCYSCRENGRIYELTVLSKPVFCDNCGNLFASLNDYYSKTNKSYYDDFLAKNGVENSEVIGKSVEIDEFAISDAEVKSLGNRLVSEDKLIESDTGYSYYRWHLPYVIGKSGQKTLRGFTTVRLPEKVFVWLEP